MNFPNYIEFEDDDLFPMKALIQGSEGVKDFPLYSLAHWHNCLEFMYMDKGEMDFYINGETFHLSAGDMVFVGSDAVHSTDGRQTGHAYFVLMDSTVCNKGFGGIEKKYVDAFLNSFGNKFNYHIVRNDAVNKNIVDYLINMRNEYKQKKIAYETSMMGDLYMLITELIRGEYIKVENSFNSFQTEIINKAIDYIGKNYARNIDVKSIANYCNLSYNYFSGLFKKVTNKNVKEYIDFVRISEAEKFMMQSECTYYYLCEKIGIPDQASFNRVYKRVRGITPSEFKKSLDTSNK